MEESNTSKIARLSLFSVWLLIAAAVSLSACSYMGTVRKDVNTPEFQAENVPIRTLEVAVFSDGFHPYEKIKRVMTETSYELERQAGIRLRIASFQPIKWKGRSIKQMYYHLRGLTEDNQDKFDIVVASTWHSPFELVVYSTLGFAWRGWIDDIYRRYIIIKNLNTYVLMHEIGHVFIFSHDHSSLGLMQGFVLKVVPFLPPLNQTIYLTPEDREEVLKNKWRGFHRRNKPLRR